MQTLYPDPKVIKTRSLERGIHRIHIEESGNPAGFPVLLLHGGPGVGLDPLHRRLVDAERFWMIQFDQRGSGHSAPLAETQSNTLEDLVADIEAIRQALGIERWLVFGQGWGATVALAYARQQANDVAGMVLSGVFLGREEDLQWYFGGAARFFPDAWGAFTEGLQEGVETGIETLLAEYEALLLSENELQRIQAARRWARWLTTVQVMHPSQALSERLQHPHVALSLARLSCHYFRHRCFLGEKPLLGSLSALADTPGIMVHGRFDVLSPLKAASLVHEEWPASELYIVREGSHSLYDQAMADASMRALDQLGARLLGDDAPAAD